MAKTSHDARRHIREWSRFFGDGMVVTEKLVDDFIKKHKKKKYLKQSLRRLIEKGLIARNDNKFILSSKGNSIFKLYKNRNLSNWDHKWYLISFDIPVNFNRKRDSLRRVLKIYNFYQLQKSVWVGPNQFSEDLWEFIVNEDLDKYCKVMVVEIIEGDEDLRKYFRDFVIK